ncbi:hypothetical protein MRX96_035400 [Rhipicephalus microplus]
MAKTSLALTRAPAPSYARLKATKTPLKKTMRAKIDQKAEPDTSALDQAGMECQDSVAGDDITQQENERTDGISGGKERDDDGGRQMVLTVRQKESSRERRKETHDSRGGLWLHQSYIQVTFATYLAKKTTEAKATTTPQGRLKNHRKTIPRTTYKTTNRTTNCKSRRERVSRYNKRSQFLLWLKPAKGE